MGILVLKADGGAETNPAMASARVKSLLKAGRNTVIILFVFVPIFLILLAGIVLALIAFLANEDGLRFIIASLFAARTTFLSLSMAYARYEETFLRLGRLVLELNLIAVSFWIPSSDSFSKVALVVRAISIPLGILLVSNSLKELFKGGSNSESPPKRTNRKTRRLGYRKAKRSKK